MKKDKTKKDAKKSAKRPKKGSFRTLNDYSPKELARLRRLSERDTLEATRVALEVLGSRAPGKD